MHEQNPFEFHSSLRPCVPPRWAKTGHLQTILGYLIPSPRLSEEGERLEVNVSGNDKLVGRIFRGSSPRVVYVFHGLGGSIDATYMHRTALVARKRNDTVILFNHRGCGEGERLAKEPYHSGRAEDLSAVIKHGRKLFPTHQHLAVGFSLSANALLLLASGQRTEFGAQDKPDAAIAVNAPINLKRASQLLREGLNRVYDVRFMRNMREAVTTRLHHDPKLADLRIPLLSTLYDFDELYTAPHGGFESRDHYYATCSAKQYLGKIEIPTLILTAADDPFVDIKDYREAKLSKFARLHIEAHGGHMGYLSCAVLPTGTKRWLDYALEEAMRALPLPAST